VDPDLASKEVEISAAEIRDVTPQWCTRGWTLQKLIAPPDVEFYNFF
jgi:hypothetical protein